MFKYFGRGGWQGIPLVQSDGPLTGHSTSYPLVPLNHRINSITKFRIELTTPTIIYQLSYFESGGRVGWIREANDTQREYVEGGTHVDFVFNAEVITTFLFSDGWLSVYTVIVHLYIVLPSSAQEPNARHKEKKLCKSSNPHQQHCVGGSLIISFTTHTISLFPTKRKT